MTTPRNDLNDPQTDGTPPILLEGSMLAICALKSSFLTILTVVVGCALRGDIVLIFLLLTQSIKADFEPNGVLDNGSSSQQSDDIKGASDLPLDVLFFVTTSIVSSQGILIVVSAYFHYCYYVARRSEAHEWKCQPRRFLTPENAKHEIGVGITNMTLLGVVSGLTATYVYRGGRTTLYFDFSHRSLLYLVLSTVAFFFYIEAISYYTHRLWHTPYLYKRFHKHHHRYHSPTAFASVAMTKLEILLYQSYLIMPLFGWFEIYAGAYVVVLLYIYYFGLVDHSGVKMESWFPWQPPSTFHDNHHEFFHCNFGFNTYFFDKLHNTLRQEHRRYGEDVFGGHGKPEK